MLYLLDANTLIDANRDYYPLERVPEFWTWIIHHAKQSHIGIPVEIIRDLTMHSDALATWLRTHKSTLLLDDSLDPKFVDSVLRQGYGEDLTVDEIDKIGSDAFLVAYALKDSSRRSVATTERSRPSRKRSNRHLPDVCSDFNLNCYHTFELIRKLDFRSNWNKLELR